MRANVTLAELAREWLEKREPRLRKADGDRLRDHVLPLLGNRRVRDLSAEDVTEVVRRTLAKKGMNAKSARNAYAAFADLLGDALARGVLASDPRQLPADVWPAEDPADQPRFSAAEVQALTTDERLDLDQRTYNLLVFHSGLDSEALCQLRFSDWRERVPTPSPLLEAALEAWQREGFERIHGRAPTAEDWLLPRRSDVTQPLSEGAAFKNFRRACVALKIKTRSPRAIQNTFAAQQASGSGLQASGSQASGGPRKSS